MDHKYFKNLLRHGVYRRVAYLPCGIRRNVWPVGFWFSANHDGKGMFWGGVTSAFNEALSVIEQIERED